MANIQGTDGGDNAIYLQSSHANTNGDPAETHETVRLRVDALITAFNNFAGAVLNIRALTASDVVTLGASSNNIGDVDIASLPSLPEGSNSIGSVTANAGTDLNTSGLALEDGGVLDSILAAIVAGLGISGLPALDVNSLPSLPTGGSTIGTVGVSKGTLSQGAATVTVAGTAEQVTDTSTPLVSGVQIQWNPNNTGRVYLGAAGVGNNLSAPYVDSEVRTFFLDIANLDQLYLNADNSGDGILYIST